MRASWQFLALTVLTVVIGGAWLLQRQANGELRGLIVLLREKNQEVDRLQEERSRLMQAQVSAAELERLRADHAAVVRLRGEIETAQARVIEMERVEAAATPAR